MLTRDDPNYQQTAQEELQGHYEVQCDYCGSRKKLYAHTSIGWRVGDYVGTDSSDPAFGRCFKCLRYKLKVVLTPIQNKVQEERLTAATLKE